MTKSRMISALVSACLLLTCVGYQLWAQSVQVTSPQNGAVVTAGQILNISVQASAGAFQAVQIVANNGFISQQITSSPYVFSFTIPKTSLEAIQVTALGIVGRDQGVVSAPVTIAVEPAAPVKALQVDSPYVFLNYIGNQKSVLIHGAFSDGSNIDLPRSAITYVSSDTTVAVGTEDGFIRAVGPGTATVTANYGGQSVSLTVTVPTLIRGDLNGDGQVDQLDVQQLLLAFNKVAVTSHDARDLNGDGKIDALDARIEATLCTHPRCAVQ